MLEITPSLYNNGYQATSLCRHYSNCPDPIVLQAIISPSVAHIKHYFSHPRSFYKGKAVNLMAMHHAFSKTRGQTYFLNTFFLLTSPLIDGLYGWNYVFVFM